MTSSERLAILADQTRDEIATRLRPLLAEPFDAEAYHAELTAILARLEEDDEPPPDVATMIDQTVQLREEVLRGACLFARIAFRLAVLEDSLYRDPGEQ